MLGVVAVILKLVRHQIVAHVIPACRQNMFARKSVVIERADVVLHVAVITHITVGGHEVVALVVLVEGIRQLYIVVGGR